MTLNTKCPSCGSSGMSPFYSVDDVPVHSCIMLSDEREARDFPRGRIELGVCGACGFVSNMAFDPGVQDYSTLYEDQQCYSPTFNAFASGLVRKLLEKYDLHGKDLLEIGCGKGDFLNMLCDAGDNRGVGIDPACDPKGIEGPASDRITVVQDYYSERYAHYTGDMVICRHTLEHIYETRAFLENVRAGIGNGTDTIVFLEVPDVGIVLDNLVFWDIYYEHCSYFSPGSLARLFRSCRFDVLDLYLGFDDQYLLIEARPVEGTAGAPHPLEESVENLTRRVERFRGGVAHRKEQWIRRIRELAAAGKKPVIWGSGSKCVAFLTTLGIDREIEGVVDINPRRHGKYIAGAVKQVMPPEYLRELRPGAIIVMNPIYKREIGEMASGMGLSAEILTV
jgi:hypothetical protein